MLLTSLVGLMPAAGTALCLGDRGHVEIELIDRHCSPSMLGDLPATSCTPKCGGCEDIPLSMGLGDRVLSRHETSAIDAIDVAPRFDKIWSTVMAAPGVATPHPVDVSSPFLARPALLRC